MIDQVPGYRILERAGEGGFSVVYRAHQQRLDRIVALKVLSVDAVDQATMRRFERECQITGRLTGHPNVVTVLDTGMSEGGRPFIAMDYFERGSLRDRLAREGSLPVPDVLRAGVKIAGALAATHEAEVLHRDVKPQNILVSKYGEPALADFGVARLVDSSENTHTNAFTPHHAAPEVVNGQPPGVTSDIYSLASTLYQLLAGEPAFKSGKESGIGPLMMRILNEPPPPFRRADVPPQVFEVIAKAMAKQPADRFPNAIAFATGIQQVQAELGLPVTELAASDTAPPTAPPPPPLASVPIEHSGLTGTGWELVPPPPNSAPQPPQAQPINPRQAPMHSPVPPAAPGPKFPPESTFPPMRREAAIPPYTPPGQGPVSPPQQPQRPGGNNRGMMLAGGLVAALVVIGAGVGGVLVMNQKDDPKPKPSPPPSTATSTAPNANTNAPPPVPDKTMKADRPRAVQVKDRGRLVSVRWKLGSDRTLPIALVQSDGTTQSTPTMLPNGSTSSNVPVTVGTGYCFWVGAVVATATVNGGKAVISWSTPTCIRGATTTTQTPRF